MFTCQIFYLYNILLQHKQCVNNGSGWGASNTLLNNIYILKYKIKVELYEYIKKKTCTSTM